MTKVYPVLLAGGSGKRLWPLSRGAFPKQFSPLMSEKSLFQKSAQRLTSSEIIKFEPHITVTNSDFRFIVCEQLQELGIDPGPVLIEPEAKNTAAAILAASMFAVSKDKNAILLIAPSDHVISETRAFHEAVSVGLEHAKRGMFVTFGIEPTHPETGYGYLQLSESTGDQKKGASVKKFIEKPDLINAKRMLEAGNFLWNAGIFLFRAKDMISAFDVLSKETLELVSRAIGSLSNDLGFLRLCPTSWSQLKNVSIDCEIMERADNLVAVPYRSGWSDLGGWDAVWSESAQDSVGNAISSDAFAIECSNTLLRSETEGQQLIGLGLENIMAIAMSDAVLVAHKDRAQDVKMVVELLGSKQISQANFFPRDRRPWGWFESLAIGQGFQVKKIYVKPGAALSLQSHRYRSEHWVVVEGRAKVTIDKSVQLLVEGQTIYVPKGAVHRMENQEKKPLLLIEVQIGSYLGEDDIVRYEDLYSRK